MHLGFIIKQNLILLNSQRTHTLFSFILKKPKNIRNLVTNIKMMIQVSLIKP